MAGRRRTMKEKKKDKTMSERGARVTRGQIEVNPGGKCEAE